VPDEYDPLERVSQLVAEVADQAGRPRRWEHIYLLLAFLVLVGGAVVLALLV
jgi:hypothetical protein